VRNEQRLLNMVCSSMPMRLVVTGAETHLVSANLCAAAGSLRYLLLDPGHCGVGESDWYRRVGHELAEKWSVLLVGATS